MLNTRAEKEGEVKVLSDKFTKAKGAFVIDFKGMKVGQVTNLRKKLHATESEMKVVRNTLVRRALSGHEAASTALTPSLKGTNAIVFSYGEVNATAKALSEFAKEVEVLQIKTGLMDGEALNESKIKYLASLPGKDALRSMLLSTFLAPGNKFARVLDAYVKKMNGDSGSEVKAEA